MTERELLDALLSASNIQQLEDALGAYMAKAGSSVSFVPVGRRPNNRGAIEVATDPGRSLIERVTNAFDALLELEHTTHSGVPTCKSPREAASAWLGVPDKDGLSGLTNKQRQDLAAKTVVRLEPGEGTQSRLVSVIDHGIGILPERLEGTILSLNESNKISKHYLAGTYGQGGSSTFVFCRYAVIVSRAYGADRIGFTVVKYEDLPAEDFKTGRYVFLTRNDKPLEADAVGTDQKHGTTVRHFGYDLTRYTSALGSKSMYGMLGRVMFDPVSALRLEERLRNPPRNRTIKGARNSLNGAVDDGDEGKGPQIDHAMPLFNISLGDFGSIGLEYWVMARPEATDGKKRTKPSENFVDASKPIILTHNGQNQDEISGRLLKEDADLPYLHAQGRLICHVNCDRLSAHAKRLLFSSTREQSREGVMLERIRTELVGALKADDELVRLNEQAHEDSLKEKDENAQKQMRKQVARLLRIAGASLQEVGGTQSDEDGGKEVKPRPPRPKPTPIVLSDPPTYVRIVWEEESHIRFYGGQRRYVRIETDANSDYGDKINIALGDLKEFSRSPLKGGRMRVGVECGDGLQLGSTGSIRVELYRKGLPALSDEREYKIVEPPPPKESGKKSSLPDFEVIPVSGPEDEDWTYIVGEDENHSVTRHATNFVMNKGKLNIYYSEAFPRFATELKRWQGQSEASASSFRTRYEMWLAVHSLLMYQETDDERPDDVEEKTLDDLHRQERSRYGVIAAMIASQETKQGVSMDEDDAA